MQKIIGVTELQRNFRAIFDEVLLENMPDTSHPAAGQKRPSSRTKSSPSSWSGKSRKLWLN